MQFILDKILKLWHITRLSIISRCKIIWSQKQSGFWPTLYIPVSAQPRGIRCEFFMRTYFRLGAHNQWNSVSWARQYLRREQHNALAADMIMTLEIWLHCYAYLVITDEPYEGSSKGFEPRYLRLHFIFAYILGEKNITGFSSRLLLVLLKKYMPSACLLCQIQRSFHFLD